MADDRERAASLVRSAVRVELLRRLRGGTRTRYELREALDCSRTTVDRNLDCLAEAGWVRQVGEGYTITTAGTFTLESALEFVETVGVATRLQPILRHVPRSELDVDLVHLADAEVTVAGEATPLAMIDRHVARLVESSRCRMLLPVTGAQPFETGYRRVVSGEQTAEHVVTESVAEVFLTHPRFAEMTAELLETERFSVAVTDEDVPYYLGVLDGTVQIGVSEDGEPRGLLEAESEPVREWAHRRIDGYLDSAVPLTAWGRQQELTIPGDE